MSNRDGVVHIEIKGLNINALQHPSQFVYLEQYYALYTRAHGIIYFTRGHGDIWTRLAGEPGVIANKIIHILDPITALLRGLATPEDIGLGGVETLVALLRPI